jgi:hypothetical protein
MRILLLSLASRVTFSPLLVDHFEQCVDDCVADWFGGLLSHRGRSPKVLRGHN